jgi:carbamoyl-phosphate synthase large subunit
VGHSQPLSPVTVLVVGSELRAGPRAIRSLKQAGYRVLGAHVRDPFGGRSLPCPRPLRHPPLDGDPGLFAEWLAGTVRREGVAAVLGANEDAARMLARSDGALGDAVRVGPDAAQYDALCDKWNLAETARAAGVPHPATVLIHAGTAAAEIPLPAIIKPRESGEGVEHVALKAEIVRTAGELETVLALLAAHGTEAIAQEIVTGPRTSLHAVSTSRGLVALATQVVRDYPRGRGVTSLGRGVAPPPELRAAVERLCATVGYRGALTVGVIDRGGELFVHDVNLRLPASMGMSMAAGLDMPRLAVDDALGRPIDHLIPAASGRSSYISIDLEAAALIDALRGRGPGERPGEIIRDATRHLRSGGRVLIDPNPLDPFWLPLTGARIARRTAARVLRPRAARPVPTVGYPAVRGPQGPGPT